jgi:hypothetical protein
LAVPMATARLVRRRVTLAADAGEDEGDVVLGG